MFLLLFISLFSQAHVLPQPHGQLGEQEYLYLNKPGFIFQAINNDFLGNTDKYMTSSTGLAYLKDEKSWAWEFGFFRRLYTPALESDFSHEEFSSPKGVLADDSQIRFSAALTFAGLEFFPELSLHLIGEQRAQDVYKFIHQIVGSPDDFKRYGPEKSGSYLSPGIKIVKNLDKFWFGGGFYAAPMIEDWYLEIGIHLKFSEYLKGSLQYKKIRQPYSLWYEDLKEYRDEAQLAFNYNWYTLSFGYNSAFLKSDPAPQIFISPLNINFKF